MSLLAQAVSTTVVLLATALFSKLLLDVNEPTASAARELLTQALHRRAMAAQATDPALRLQYAAGAATLLQAARTVLRDEELERATGRDVTRLARSLEHQVSEARQTLWSGAESVKTV